ncbi:Modification methylase DpnIIA [compost metagenome]
MGMSDPGRGVRHLPSTECRAGFDRFDPVRKSVAMADGAVAIHTTGVTPPLKWAGGKRWLVQRLVGSISIPYSRLIEPFAGSAATFFKLAPARAILTDKNNDLIEFYEIVRDDPSSLLEALTVHAEQHSKDYYYAVRSAQHEDAVQRAARLLYLNRTCWNALYRVNQKGQFNVPKGTKDRVLLATDDFPAVSRMLSRCDLRCDDFEVALAEATHGDLIFADPPYFSKSVSGTFVKYNGVTFSWADQERLATAITAAHRRGAHFILTNVDTPELSDLYAHVGFTSRIERQSVISGLKVGRKTTSELLWTSFALKL